MSRETDAVVTEDLRWRLRDARRQQGMSQGELAERIPGLHHFARKRASDYVCAWETGSHLPTFGMAVRWARALGLELTLRPTDPAPTSVGAVRSPSASG